MVQLLQADDISICLTHFLQYQWQPVLPLQAADGHLQEQQQSSEIRCAQAGHGPEHVPRVSMQSKR
jgi:hypothetical protein